MRHLIRHLVLIAIVSAGGVVLPACAPEKSQEQTMRDRQDAAVRDPFHYSPDMDRTDVSGGGVGNFDHKAFGRDVNDLINP